MIQKTLFPLLLLLLAIGLLNTSNALSGEAAGLKMVTLKVDNMTCSLCPYTVKKSLVQVPGVEKAEVDFDSKTVQVTFDPAKADIAMLTEATGNAGYPSQLKQ